MTHRPAASTLEALFGPPVERHAGAGAPAAPVEPVQLALLALLDAARRAGLRPPAPPTGVRSGLELPAGTDTGASANEDGRREPARVLDPRASNCNGPQTRAERLDTLLSEWRRRRREHHLRRAALAEVQGDRAAEAWHAARASALLRPFAVRSAECGQGGGAVTCACSACGEVHRWVRGCALRQWCAHCSRRWARGYERKLSAALGAAERRAVMRWNREGRRRGKRPALQLLTLTVRSTGDVERDRETIAAAWPRLRAWWHRRIGAPAYALTYEVTPGTKGQGHAHAHLAILLPYLDVCAVDQEWRKLVGEGGHVDLATRRAKRGAGRAASCARYIAKYASKGSAIGALPDDVAAAWIRATHARRQVNASRGLYDGVDVRGVSPCCGDPLFYTGYERGCVDTCRTPCHDTGGGRDGPAGGVS